MPVRLNLRGRWNVYEMLLGYSHGETDDFYRVLGAYRASQAAAQQGHASGPIAAAAGGLGQIGDQPTQALNAVRQASLTSGGDRYAGGRFASRGKLRTARREMRERRDARLIAQDAPQD